MFHGKIDWLREQGVEVFEQESSACTDLLTAFIKRTP